MLEWEVEINTGEEAMGDVTIKRRIFQGESLPPLLFVFCLILVSLILRKLQAGNEKVLDRINAKDQSNS